MNSRRLLSLIAFLFLLAFFGVFLLRMQRLDLSAVICITLGLAAYDLWLQLWRRRSR